MPPRIQADPAIQQQLAQRGITEKTGVFGEHKVQLGTGSPIKLDKIKGNSVPYQGFRSATKIARGHEGLATSSRQTLDILASPGSLKADKLLAALKTNMDYRERLDKLGQLTEAQKQDSLWSFAPAVESLSNTELAAVYQTFTSAEMDLLQTALRHEGRNNPKAGDARAAASQLFDLQALVLKEMSNRVSNGILDDLSAKEPDKAAEYESMRPASLSRQYAQKDVIPAEHDHDITAANLHTLANVAAESATRREKTATGETQKLSSRGISASPKEIGDVLRQSPLTVNIPTRRLLRDNAFILTPDQPMPTVFHMQQQGILSKGESYMAQRDETEKLVFPELEGHEVIADERPVYGALNTQRSQSGPAARAYGSCVVVLKPEVARRATFIAEDTFYSPALSITPERKANFYRLLDGSGLPAEKIAAFKNPQSAEHRALENWLEQGTQIKDLNATFLKNPPYELDIISVPEREQFSAVGLQAFGDKAATRAKVASYDNLESLLPGLDDLNGALLAQAAEKRARGEDPSVRLAMNYIEAQIHGPIIPGRDIQEIRVDLEEAAPEERAQLITRMDAFSQATGVKVVYLTDRINEAEVGQSSGTFERLNPREEDRLTRSFDAGVKYYTQHVRPEIERAIGEGLENIQNHLRTMLEEQGLTQLFPPAGEILRGSVLERLKNTVFDQLQSYMKTPSPDNNSPEKIAAYVIERAAVPLLQQKAVLLRKLEEFPLNPAQKEAFSYWIRSSLVKKPEELQLAFDNSQIQAAALRTIAEADPPLSLEETFRTLADAAQRTDGRMAAYAASLPAGNDYGTDDKNADRDRSSFLAYTLIKNGEPPLSKEQMRGLYDRLQSSEVRSLMGQLGELVGDRAVQRAKDFGSLNTISRLAILHLKNAAREVGERFSMPEFSAELSLLPESSRTILRQFAPEAMAQFDAAHPAYTPFPAAAIPGNMPSTDAARRDFLVRHLDAYIPHEQTFDKGRSTHGRGHVARAYIYASAMCTILEKQGIPVDRNAVLCGITGHDMGRQGAGTDYWEQESADMTVAAMRSDFGEATMGTDYEQAVVDNTTKRSTAVEGMILKAADSLDIGRTRTLDLSRMPFLRGKEGETISPEAKALREGLAKEADLLQRLTDPMCEHRKELAKLDNDIFLYQDSPLMLEQTRQKKQALLDKIAQSYEASWTISADQFMADMEKVIQDNPQLFPILSENYR